MKTVSFKPGWLDQVEPGRAFRVIRGEKVADQVSRKRLREHGELFTVQAVAEKLKVKPETVYDWIHRGDSRGKKLDHFKVGRHLRVSEIHIEEFLAA